MLSNFVQINDNLQYSFVYPWNSKQTFVSWGQNWTKIEAITQFSAKGNPLLERDFEL